MLDAVNVVITIFLMIAIGWFLSHIGWLGEEGATLLSRLVVQVALPCSIVQNLFTKFDRASLLASIPNMAIPFLSILLLYGFAGLLAMLIKLPERRRGVFQQMFAFSNTVFIGVPVSLALFGEDALPVALLFYIANTVLYWTLGVPGVQRDGGQQPARLFSAAWWKRLASMPLLTFFACALLILLGVKLPSFALSAANYVGALVTPLSLLFTGFMLHKIEWRKIRVDLGLAIMLTGRFVLSPLLVWALSFLLPVSQLVLSVFVVQAGMPTMSQSPIVARMFGADSEYVALGTALSTVLSLLFIPLYKYILG